MIRPSLPNLHHYFEGATKATLVQQGIENCGLPIGFQRIRKNAARKLARYQRLLAATSCEEKCRQTREDHGLKPGQSPMKIERSEVHVGRKILPPHSFERVPAELVAKVAAHRAVA